ncbi:hypothetical protein MMC25_006368 [Agyrium rufum]|nr:hypothetical protein [Agyrium rufum]
MSVFGALNRFISRLDSEPVPSQTAPGFRGSFGFQVLRNKNPDVPIDPWFDFIVGINGRQIDDPEPHLFATEVRNCAGSNVTFSIWSAKGQRLRDLHLPIPTPSPTLGLTLQWTPLILTSNVWHILDVLPNSPADTAGLLPYSDYVLGTPDGLVHGESGLGELIDDYISRPLRLFVYNHENSVTRLVTITPSRSWGGSGALGCVLGFGALHQLPLPLTEPPQAPGETLFEMGRFSNEEARSRSPFHHPSSHSHQPTPQPYDAPYTITSSAFNPSIHHLQTPETPSFYSPISPTNTSNLLIPASMMNPSSPPHLPPSQGTSSLTSPPSGATVAGRASRKRGQKGAISPNRAFDEYFKESEEKSREEDYMPGSSKAGSVGVPPPPPSTHTASGSLSGEKKEEEGEVESPAEDEKEGA